jgi:hypothetical protein
MTAKKKPAERKGAGRPRIVLDEEQIKALAGIHCSLAEMAAVMDCSVSTLSRNYAEAIEKGRENGKASLKRKQFELAMKGDRVMLIWLGKQYLDQTEKKQITARLEHRHDLSKLSDGELTQLEKLTRKAAAEKVH